MFCKLFASLYQGTLRGRSHEILVFTNLIANATAKGHVDKHPRAISEEVGLTLDEVNTALANLESTDPESRSPDEDGRRIIRMDEHRAWGWRIVNYGKYRAIKNEEDRREQNRLSQARWREKNGGVSSVSTSKQRKPKEKEKIGKRTKSRKDLRFNEPDANSSGSILFGGVINGQSNPGEMADEKF